ncbi:MAG: hypothetical protein GXX08_10910 [Firmicutes bacterium]|nr:hypothetical protein [Bacillota bacterium]
MKGLRLLGRRPSTLMLVVVKPASSKFRIIVPIPVALVTVLVETVGFWSYVLGKLGVRLSNVSVPEVRKATRTLSKFNINCDSEDLGSLIFAVFKEIEGLWMELISHGSWTLVDIRSSSGDRVHVRFI